MIEEFGLTSEPLIRLAATVRGADTARPELTPHRIGSHVLLDAWLWAIAVLSAAAALLGASFWITLPAAGLAYAFAVARQYVAVASVLALAVLVVIGSGIVDWPAEATASPRAQQQAPQLSNLFFSGLKAGLLTFGGAYTVIPFLRDDAVGHGWMSDA